MINYLFITFQKALILQPRAYYARSAWVREETNGVQQASLAQGTTETGSLRVCSRTILMNQSS